MTPLAARAPRIAHRRGMLLLLPRLAGALGTAVDLAAIATAADDRPAAAGQTQKLSARDRLSLRCLADPSWTYAAIGGMVSLHACPARCGARRRCRTAKLPSAPCLPPSLAESWHAAERLLRSDHSPRGARRQRRACRVPTLVGANAPPAVGTRQAPLPRLGFRAGYARVGAAADRKSLKETHLVVSARTSGKFANWRRSGAGKVFVRPGRVRERLGTVGFFG